MGHYSVHSLICLCWCYVSAGVPDAAEVTIPHRVSASGSFISHHLPTYWHRAATHDDPVHYLVHLGGEAHHLELRPNRALLAPNASIEHHSKDGIHVRKARNVQCHFQGKVKGVRSRVAVSTCNGLKGYISTPRGHFMIEPREALTDDRHPHLVYHRHRDLRAPEAQAEAEAEETEVQTPRECPNRGPTENHRKKRENKEEIKVATDVKNDLYLEILIVLDKTFVDHHTEMDTEHYVMTIMNMAHNLFAQESLGRPVYLSIVRIIRLEVEDNEINVVVNENPSKALESFQKWQALVNPGNDSHPNHHDLAILLTRVDIYANDNYRDFLGVSRQAGTCSRHTAGVIAQDLGLMLGNIVAHEIGHSLGFLHDEPGVNGCNATLQNGMSTVMSPRISIMMGDWSTCSKKYLRIFVESGFGHCLLDHPGDHSFSYTDELPGVLYDANWQCRAIFGSNAQTCNTAPRCDTLLCEIPKEGCIKSQAQPADGTTCGEDKWCYNGQCLERGMRPGARDGAWGPWGPWSACSRTCGTGVAHRERRCDSPVPASGGELCRGPKKKYRICNAEPCPDSISFRDAQCAKFNSWVYPEDGNTHKWKAVNSYIDDAPCALYCVNDAGDVANLVSRVIDGTSCMRGMRDVCIAGNCISIPCDLVLDSEAVEDVCGVCKGDGTSCTLKEGIKTFQDPCEVNNASHSEKIFKLVDLPEGSQNIHIEESEPSKCKIEVRDVDGNETYVSGENFGLFDVPGSKAWLGMLRANQDTLYIPGPIRNPLTIWVDPRMNTTLKYSLAVETDKRQGTFVWENVDWTPCSTLCGVGTAVSKPKCIEKSSGLVDNSYCTGEKPPTQVKSCENKPCPSRWFVGDWEQCEKFNASSTQRRFVRCVRPIGGELSDLIVTQESTCSNPKPIDHKNCPTFRRKRRKVFHTPIGRKNTERLNTWRSKSRKERNRKERRTDESKEFLKVEKEDVKKFTFQKDKINLDRLNRDGLELQIKTEEVVNGSTRTSTKEFYGKDVEAEMERLLKSNPKKDQI